MKRVLSIACLSFTIALTLALQATPAAQAGAPTAGMKIATDADYAAHMKEIGQLNGVLNKSIKAGDGCRGGQGRDSYGSALQEHSHLLDGQKGCRRDDGVRRPP